MSAVPLPSDMTPGATVPNEEQELAVRGGWVLKELKPWHRNMCSMLAQGIPRNTIAAILDCTPEYISMLARQPLIQKYVKEWCEYAGLQLEAQFTKVVDTIGDTLHNGNYKEKMEASRLHAQLTHRIGSGGGVPNESTDMNSRLVDLSQRLVGLLETKKEVALHVQEIQDAEFSSVQISSGDGQGQLELQPAQDVSDGVSNP